MSYIVPREKPHYCIGCIFLDRNYRNCKLQKVDYCDFNKQYKNCPLIDVNETLFSADNARKFLKENPPKEGNNK